MLIKSASLKLAVKFCSSALFAAIAALSCASMYQYRTNDYTDIAFLGDGVHYAVSERYMEHEKFLGETVLNEKWSVYIGDVNSKTLKKIFSSPKNISRMFTNLNDTVVSFMEGDSLIHTYKYTGVPVNSFAVHLGTMPVCWSVPYSYLVVNKQDGIYKTEFPSGAESFMDTGYCVDAQSWGFLAIKNNQVKYFRNAGGVATTYDFPCNSAQWINAQEIFGEQDGHFIRYNFASKRTDTVFTLSDVKFEQVSVNKDASYLVYFAWHDIFVEKRR